MPIQINCPSCRGAVRVPEALLSKRVQCPKCQATFVAEIEDEGPPDGPAPKAVAASDATPPVNAGEETRPRRPHRPRPDDDYDDYDDDRPRRRAGRPHRGGAILALGILSLVVACFPIGIFAWVLSNHDLEAMRRGEMDREGEGITIAGRICGIVGTVFFAIVCLAMMAYFGLIATLVGGALR